MRAPIFQPHPRRLYLWESPRLARQQRRPPEPRRDRPPANHSPSLAAAFTVTVAIALLLIAIVG
jgi:hypothetical protein